MEFFYLPTNSIINKEIPTKTVLEKIGRKANNRYPFLATHIKSCFLYAILNNSTYSIDSPENRDDYYNEILFLLVNVDDMTNIEVITKCFLRIFHYQTVIVFRSAADYCFASGLVRDTKRNTGNRTIIDCRISPWQREEVSDNFQLLNFNMVDKSSFETMYRSYNNAISRMNEKKIQLSFVVDLYAYTHGMEPEFLDISEKIRLQKRIKDLCPNNRFMSKTGKEKYIFDDSDVLDLLIRSGAYFGGCDSRASLVEMLYNFVNFESDFNIEIPKSLMEEIAFFGEVEYDDVDSVLDVEEKPMSMYEYEERHWFQTGFQKID